MGDLRTYEDVRTLRAVTSVDGAHFYPFDSAFVGRVTDEVEGINRTVHDFTSDPPGTIEWE